MSLPVLFVHGLWDSGRCFLRMRRELDRQGNDQHAALDLRPNDGRAPVLELARQVEEAADTLRGHTGAPKLDIVGFSMGALVSRAYVQRLSGKSSVRRLISISGPHHGTTMANYWFPFSGVRDMRPRSAFLSDLQRDEDPFGEVEVHTLWTRHDRMIRPPTSSRLEHATSDTEIPAWSHRLLLMDRRTVHKVLTLLNEPCRDGRESTPLESAPV